MSEDALDTAHATDPHRDWPTRTPLYDDGRLVAIFTTGADQHEEAPWVDGVWCPSHVDTPKVADVLAPAFAGWRLSTSDFPLAAELVARGALVLRHVHTMTHDLLDLPAYDGQATVARLSAPDLVERAAEVDRVLRSAYPPGHPDHRDERVTTNGAGMRRVASGEVLGPLLDCSSVALAGGTVAGACLVVERDGRPPDGGPWVLEIFRDPAVAARGIGRALLATTLALAFEARLPGLSLVVSDANVRARSLYTALGFQETAQSLTLLMPPMSSTP